MIAELITSSILKSKMKKIAKSDKNSEDSLKDKAFLKMIFSFLHKRAEKILQSKPKLVGLITKALKFFGKISDIPFLKKRFLDIPNLCDMLTDVVNGTYKEVPYSSLLMIVMAIIYMVIPVDILPDCLFLAGLVDDAAVLKMVLDTVKNDLDAYNSRKTEAAA